MSRYTRTCIPGGSYFFTVVTYRRDPWLTTAIARITLRRAITEVRAQRPFSIDAWVLLPDHMHCVWTLPAGDTEYGVRWRLIKRAVSIGLRAAGVPTLAPGPARERRRERGFWQRRFWEHALRDEEDFRRHCDYVHYNPVRHGLCRAPSDWPFSSFARSVEMGRYPADWGAAADPVADVQQAGE